MTCIAGPCHRSIVTAIIILCLNLIPSGVFAQLEGTARDYFTVAEEEAMAWQGDAALRYVVGVGEELHLAGELLTWTYFFESSQAESLYLVTVALGLPIFSGGVVDSLSLIDPLPENWIDSDDAVAVAESNGGSDFRQNTGSDLIVAAAGVGLYLLDLDRPVWLFTYTDTTNYLATTFIYVDAVTGAWIETQGVGIGDTPDGIAPPRSFTLSQNYPNPFNPSTTLEYTVPDGAARAVALEIYDVRGRRVRTLFRGNRDPGVYQVHWDGRDDRGSILAAGIYLVKLRSEQEIRTRKMTLSK